jgi:murein DD-endopeptidase MepM/ murein hydrolase activator NlpD
MAVFCKPFSGNRDVICPFGERVEDFHYGTDYKMPIGTSVHSPFKAVVHKIVLGESFRGNVLELECKDETEPTPYLARFFHLEEILVQEGQAVSVGQKVALSGNSGLSTEAHLHFTLLPSKDSKLEEAIDPELSFMKSSQQPCYFTSHDSAIREHDSYEQALEFALNNDDLWNDPNITCNIQKACHCKDLSYLLTQIVWLSNNIKISKQIKKSQEPTTK